MSSCGTFYASLARTPVNTPRNRTNEHVDDDEVTPTSQLSIRKNRAGVEQKLDKVLLHLKSQKEENSKLREALTELNGKVSELQEKASFSDSANSGRRIPPGLSVS